MEKIWKFIKDEEGLTMVEYAVMAVLISAAVIVTIAALGTQINTQFQRLIAAIQ